MSPLRPLRLCVLALKASGLVTAWTPGALPTIRPPPASPFLILNLSFLIFIASVLPHFPKTLIPPEGETPTFLKKIENPQSH